MCSDRRAVHLKFRKQRMHMAGLWGVGRSIAVDMPTNPCPFQVRHISGGFWKDEQYRMSGSCPGVRQEVLWWTERKICLERRCAFGIRLSRHGESIGVTLSIIIGKIRLGAGAVRTSFKSEFARMEHQPSGPSRKSPRIPSTGSEKYLMLMATRGNSKVNSLRKDSVAETKRKSP